VIFRDVAVVARSDGSVKDLDLPLAALSVLEDDDVACSGPFCVAFCFCCCSSAVVAARRAILVYDDAGKE
jgi:hypothetical protein